MTKLQILIVATVIIILAIPKFKKSHRVLAGFTRLNDL
jgi:hypothetical protein